MLPRQTPMGSAERSSEGSDKSTCVLIIVRVGEGIAEWEVWVACLVSASFDEVRSVGIARSGG